MQHKLEADLLSKEDMVPKTIKGTKTDVIVVGQIVAGPLAPDIEPINQAVYGSDDGDFADWNMQEELDDILPEPKESQKPRQRWRRHYTPLFEVFPEQLHQRSRPVRGGFSIGHYKVTAGTMATACYNLGTMPVIPSSFTF